MTRKPRYLDLASALRKNISGGDYAIGDQLPTEHQLCAQHTVSRHTARAALQVLEDEGLIERRPGLGTTVISAGEASAFSQMLGGLNDLLQYAHEAQLKITGTEHITLTPSLARQFGAPRGSRWLVLHGVRIAKGKSIAATSIYISDIIPATESDFHDPAMAITEHIEARYGVSVTSIMQTINAETILTSDSAALGATPGQPILRTIRRYLDAAERLFVVSDTRHPSDRFVYEMAYKRDPKSK